MKEKGGTEAGLLQRKRNTKKSLASRARSLEMLLKYQQQS